MEFKVGDKVVLNKKGLAVYGKHSDLAQGVTITYLGQTNDGPFIGWAPACGGCYNRYLQLVEPSEGPW